MKHILKKLLALTLTLLMLAALTLPAAADVIYEPENLFYKTHSEECEYIRSRRYLTNSDEGYVYLSQSPVSDLTVTAYPNGTEVTLTWIYTSPEGEQWGILSDESGWLRLSELSLIYDSQEFLKDNGSKCVPYEDGSFAGINGSNASPVLGWTYPGGEKSHYTINNGDVTQFVRQTYTDENGTVWGYIVYMYGMRDFWVCLSAPYDESVGGYALPDHEITLRHEPVTEAEIPVSGSNVFTVIIAGVLVLAAVLGTAVLIRILFRRKSGQ